MKKLNLDKSSMVALMQEVYFESVEQRKLAINKIKEQEIKSPEDVAMVGKFVSDMMKHVSDSIDKKIQLLKIQATYMDGENKGNTFIKPEDVKITDDQKKSIMDAIRNQKLLGDIKKEENIQRYDI
jgi:hypothetical protein